MSIQRLSLFVLVGMITAAQAGPAGTPEVFSRHDLDGDGYLSRAEYQRLQQDCLERRGERCRRALYRFESLDADGDDRISEEEVINRLGRRYRGGRSEPSRE